MQMRATAVVFTAMIGALAMGAVGLRHGVPAGAASRAEPHGAVEPTPLRLAFEREVDTLVAALDSLESAAGEREMRRALRTARSAYKRTEWLLEYYSPTTSATLNGPLPEDDGDAPARPLGSAALFQQVESALLGIPHAEPTGASITTARLDAATMRAAVVRFRSQTRLLHIGQGDFLDAARLELARLTTLGLSGVDSEQSGDAVVEAAAALDGMSELVRAARVGPDSSVPAADWSAFDAALRAAVAYLRDHQNFDRLDRLTFITSFASPIGHAIARARVSAQPPVVALRRTWRLQAATVFDPGAFDPSAFAPEYAPASSAKLVTLGRRLFFDNRLSGPRTRSCASCHDPSRAFTDGRSRSLTSEPAKHALARNTPTLINAAFQPLLFADERAGSLEEQVGNVLASAAEMASSAELAAERIKADASYRAQFADALGFPPRVAVTELTLRVALAAYVRSLTALDSPFDRAARGDAGALTPQERRGFNTFAGKARCATCHFIPLFNGTAPPAFVASEVEIIGVPRTLATAGATLDPDPGRGRVDHVSEHQFAFRVPTLRNIALTAPYMHNGAFATLDEVVDFYDHGGGAGIGMRLPTQTLRTTPLYLTRAERADLIAFLRALTDTGAIPTSSRRTTPSPF